MAHKGEHLEYPGWVTKKAVPLSPTRHLLLKDTLPIPGDIAVLPNT